MSAKIAFFLAVGAAAVNVKTEERTLIHPERREQLTKIKAMATTWTAKAGRWAHEAPGASAPVLGHLGDNKLNVAAAKERGEVVEFVPKLVNPIPDSFDSAKEWPKCAKLINDIRDQSNSVWKSTSELGYPENYFEYLRELHAIEPRTYGDDAGSMAWGVRNLISTQVELRLLLGLRRRRGGERPDVHRDGRREESPDLGAGRVLQQ